MRAANVSSSKGQTPIIAEFTCSAKAQPRQRPIPETACPSSGLSKVAIKPESACTAVGVDALLKVVKREVNNKRKKDFTEETSVFVTAPTNPKDWEPENQRKRVSTAFCCCVALSRT